MKATGIVVAFLSGAIAVTLTALVVKNMLPDFQRYMRIRSM